MRIWSIKTVIHAKTFLMEGSFINNVMVLGEEGRGFSDDCSTKALVIKSVTMGGGGSKIV